MSNGKLFWYFIWLILLCVVGFNFGFWLGENVLW